MGKRDIDASVDQLQSLADGSMKHAQHDADGASHRMKQLSGGIDPTALSEIASCRQFMHALSAAVDTYAAAVDGVRKDVDNYRTALAETAKRLHADDESAAAGMTAIARRLHGPLHSMTAGRHAYDKHSVLHSGRAEDAPTVESPDDPGAGNGGNGNGGDGAPTGSTSAPAPSGSSTTYDARTGNPVPTSSTSAPAPTSSPSAPAPSGSAQPSPTPTPTPSPTPSGG